MNRTTQNNLAAPSVTIAPRRPAPGVVLYVVTLTDHKAARAYPCRSRDKATALAARFLASVTQDEAPRPAAELLPA